MNTARELVLEAFSTPTPIATARQAAERLAGLLRREHGAMADFILALADFDRDRGWAALGHASLFDFLHRRLGLSAGAAQYRKTAAALIQRFPEVEAPLRDGRLCLMSVCELARVLTEENRGEVLPRFYGLSRREAQEVAVELQPQLVPARVVVTPVARLDFAQALQPVETAVPPPAEASAAIWPGPPPAGPPPAPAPTVQPLTSERSRLHVTVSREFLKKLEAARAALSHSHPGADAEAVLEAGLDLLLERQAKRRGLVKRPRKKAPSERPVEEAQTDAGDVPSEVRREVFTRDSGVCQWALDGGGICGSTFRVELDHVIPRAHGGPSTVANLRCLCKPHNDEAARQVFGDAWMDLFSRRAPPAPTSTG